MIFVALPDIIGLVGVAVAITATVLVIRGNIKGYGLTFPVCNCIACLMVTYSLIFEFNLAAFATEVAFFSAGIYGIYLYCYRKYKK